MSRLESLDPATVRRTSAQVFVGLVLVTAVVLLTTFAVSWHYLVAPYI
jgi:hypothetical protein